MDHLHSSDLYGNEYQKFLPQLNVNLNSSAFPDSPTSARKSANESGRTHFMSLSREEAPFGGKKILAKDPMFESIMSPPITPGEKLRHISGTTPPQVSSLLKSPIPTFSNDLAARNLQFNLSPQLTMSGNPDLQYEDLYHNQDFDTYSEQQHPMYTFIGIDPNMPEQSYEDLTYEVPHPTDAYGFIPFNGNEMKASASDASLASWHPIGQPSFGAPHHNDWQVTGDSIIEKGIMGHFECKFPGCGKVFSKHTNLKSHSRIHRSERNYSCEDCHASFRRSHDLKRHQRSLHSDVKPYACGRCGKRFSRMDALKRHTSRTTSACFNQTYL